MSLILHPWVEVAATVVSEINDRLSPKNAPPTTVAVISGMLPPVVSPNAAAIGTNATIVPTLVPIERDIKQAARKSPAKSMLLGNILSVKLTVASIHPICFAELANAPANTNIHNINIIFSVLAPRL